MPSGLRPFHAGERRPNADGTYSTELTTTWQMPDGRWVNVPSLWMGESGPVEFSPDDEAGILGAMGQWEANRGGQMFPRYSSVNAAEDAARKRSDEGGAGMPGGLFDPRLMGPAQRFQPMAPEMAGGLGAPVPSQQMGGLGGGGMSFMDRMRDLRENNPEALLAIGSGLMAGDLASGFQNAGSYLQAGRDRKEKARERNITKDWLIRNKGLSEIDAEAALASPTIMNDLLGMKDSSKLTDDMREYDMARGQGFDGSFMDYMVKMKEAGRNQVNIDTGVKLPSGFQWVDPNDQNKGVVPIPGGPATQMPAELAARVGMADSFLGQIEGIKKRVKDGEVTGAWDRTKAVAGYGTSGQTYRQIQSGVDALMRLLTGAGMNESEAKQYAQRYLPTYMDDSESMLSKLGQLERELISAKDMATRGRGGATAPVPAGDGVVDFSDYFKAGR